MTNLSEQEILDLIADGESDRVEFKESLSDTSKIRKTICAFANDMPGYDKPGYVFIGVRDNGTFADISVSDEMLRTLTDMRTSGQISPMPSMSVRRVTLRDKQVAMVTVLPSDSPPVRCEGSILIRVGSRLDVATAQDERILNEKRRSLDVSYELRPVPKAALTDLSMPKFEKYLKKAFSKKVLDANQRTHEEQLAALKMIDSSDSSVPTILGLLAVGKDPQFFLPCAYVQFLKFEGEKMTDEISDNLEIHGDIPAIVERLDGKLLAHNRESVEIGGPVEKRTQLYPMVALQELTRNAIMHRAYEKNSPIRVYWFSDRIEIISPGGPYGEAIRRFGEPGVVEYRNLSLASAMRDMGLVQRYGVGIQLAREALQEGGNPALDLQADADTVRAIVYPSTQVNGR